MKTLHFTVRGVIVAATLSTALAVADAVPARVVDGKVVGNNGMTLYVFDKDAPGKSACNGPCAGNWPPLSVATGERPTGGDWSVVTRDDGSKQWAYKSRPLYFWSGDQKPGDTTGDGFNGVWHVAQ